MRQTVTETQKWKAVRTNMRASFVQAIEKAVMAFCVNSLARL